jgi:hypothetical protein
MVLVPLDAVRLPIAIWEFECVRDEVTALVDAVEIADRERPVERDMMDRPPEIDDLEASL